MLQEYYHNPSVLANLRGSLYEENSKEIKKKAKANKKKFKEDAEKLLKAENEKHMKEHTNDHDAEKEKNIKNPTKLQRKLQNKKLAKVITSCISITNQIMTTKIPEHLINLPMVVEQSSRGRAMIFIQGY